MKSSLYLVLHSLGSVAGREKQRLLTENRIIAPKYADVGPMYRTRWEDLLRFGEIGPSVFAEAMRVAEDGTLPANELEGHRDASFVLLFCIAQTQALADSFSDYSPEHGFDLDLAIIVGSMFDFQAIEVYMEVFPRSEDGRMVTDFASTISHRFPLRVSEEERGGPEVIVTPVLGLLQGDGGTRGEETHDLASRVTQWHQHTRGIWPVSGEFLVNFFLNRTLSSFGLGEGEEILAGGVHRSFDGDHSDATFGTLRVI